MSVFLKSLLSALALVGLASAQYCAPVHHQRVVVVEKPVVVEKKVVEVIPAAVYAPLAVAVPFYGGAYVGPHVMPSQQPPPAMPSGELQQILSAVREVGGKVNDIDRRLKDVEGKVNGAPQPPVQKPDPFAQPQAAPQKAQDGAQVYAGRCASCHDAAAAQAKGGKLVLFQGGKPSKLDYKTGMAVLKAARTGTMPKNGPPLNETEYVALLDYVEASVKD